MSKKTDDLAATRTIKFGDQVLPVHDPNNIQTVTGDVVTEFRVFNDIGTVSLSLGTILVHPHADGAHDPEVVVCARLRLPVAMLLDIKRMMEDATKPQVPKTEMN